MSRNTKTQSKRPPSSGPSTQTILGYLSIALVALTLVVTAYFGYLTNRPSSQPTIPSTTVPANSPLPSETPMLKEASGSQLRIQMIDGTTATINVTPVVGEIGRLLDINTSGQSIPVADFPDWPSTVANPLPAYWQALQLPIDGKAPCPNWLNRFATASMEAHLSNPVLIFAEKSGTPAMLFPISGDIKIDIIDFVARESATSTGSLTGAIQVFLIPTGTTGSLIVYDQNNFVGRSCYLAIQASPIPEHGIIGVELSQKLVTSSLDTSKQWQPWSNVSSFEVQGGCVSFWKEEGGQRKYFPEICNDKLGLDPSGLKNWSARTGILIDVNEPWNDRIKGFDVQCKSGQSVTVTLWNGSEPDDAKNVEKWQGTYCS